MVVNEPGDGDTLGPYRLERLLGEGTMGRVWSAKHVRLDRKVAIKILKGEHASNGAVISRFFDEARAVNRINHEHIVEILDFIEEREPPRVYCVMEHLDGKSLAERVDQQPLPVQAIVVVMKQICHALGAAHRVGVVHRDVKPDNVFITRRPGAPLFVKMLDFGVAKLGSDLRRSAVSKTVQGTLLGTPLFMAPEQIVGLEVDARADVYATGCLLYWLLSGRLPFDSPHFGELSMQVIRETPPELPQRTPSAERMPLGLAELAMCCLQKRPEDRPASMAAMLDALEQPHTARRTLRAKQRSLRLVVATGAVLAAAAAWSFSRERPETPSSEPLVNVEKKAVPPDEEGTIDPFQR